MALVVLLVLMILPVLSLSPHHVNSPPAVPVLDCIGSSVQAAPTARPQVGLCLEGPLVDPTVAEGPPVWVALAIGWLAANMAVVEQRVSTQALLSPFL